MGRHAKRDRKKRSRRSRGRRSDDEDDDDEYDPEDGREQDVRPRRSDSKGRSASRSPRAEEVSVASSETSILSTILMNNTYSLTTRATMT